MNKLELELRIASLSPKKRAFLEKMLHERQSTPQTFDVSPNQQGMWFLDRLLPGSTLYSVPFSYRLLGRLDVHALEAALKQIVARHETLRSRYILVDGRPVQVIEPTMHIELPIKRLSHLSRELREAEAERLTTQEAHDPFDLEKGPLLRVWLLQLEENEHLLVLNVHHLVFDGWSLGIVLRELRTLYLAQVLTKQKGARENTPLTTFPDLPALPISYADYALWQRKQTEKQEVHLQYWREHLAGAPSILDLPTDHLRPATQSFRGAVLIKPLRGASLGQALDELARQEHATHFMVLLTAWTILLQRYSRQPDLVVGTPLAGRTRQELEGLIGFFVTTLPLRVHVAENLSFRQLLGQIRTVALSAYAHQEVPLDRIVEAVAPTTAVRSLSHNPLFQVVFAADEEEIGYQVQEWDAELVAGPMQELATGTSKFDLTWTVTGLGTLQTKTANLAVNVEYSTDLFEKERIESMVEHFDCLLEAALTTPDVCLADLPLLTDLERRQVLVDWNATTTSYPEDMLLHQLIEAQVARTPDTIAVRFQEMQLTYHELNARANQLAHRLRALGVQGSDLLVGICMERSLEMIVGLLGILKAGAAYVPLDPDYPQERLAFMLQDAQVSVLLTQTHIQDRLPHHTAYVLCLESAWSSLSGQSTQNPLYKEEVSPDTLAYMIYTSGSTGKPKGAMNTHRGICNRLLWMQQTYHLQSDDKVLQKTPFSFDVSVWEFFWPLLCGACLVLARPGGHRESSYLLDIIAQEHITTLHFVPSMLSAFLENPDVEHCQGVKRVICSGEALSSELQEHFFARFGSLSTERPELHNLYGPTEAAVDVTSWACQPDTGGTSVPIGRPIANIQIYLLDKHLQPVPIGVPGDLYIAGIGLARGYFQRPGLTAERFLPHPWAQRAGERLYQTGDVARYRSDGALEYLGRSDNQVKLRGFRIELGEIEAALEEYTGVKEAVVIAREDYSGEKRLVAYLCGSADLSASALRLSLRERLPAYMIPAAFVILENLPLLSNGKRDLKALPPPEIAQPLSEIPEQIQQTESEKIIAEVWREVLHRNAITSHENFFDVGGDSLLLIKLQSRLQEVFARRVAILDLFKNPTISALAQFLLLDENATHDQQANAALQASEAAGQRAESSRRRRQQRLERLNPQEANTDNLTRSSR